MGDIQPSNSPAPDPTATPDVSGNRSADRRWVARIPEAEFQFNFSGIQGHISRSVPPVVLN
jgi:hypothetical protein